MLGRSQGDSLQLRRRPHTLPHSLCQRAMLKKLNKKEAKAIVDRLTVPSCPSLKKEHVQEATEVLGRVLVRAAKQRSTLRSSTAHSRAARQHQRARRFLCPLHASWRTAERAARLRAHKLLLLLLSALSPIARRSPSMTLSMCCGWRRSTRPSAAGSTRPSSSSSSSSTPRRTCSSTSPTPSR